MEKELIQEKLIEFKQKTSFTVISKGRVVSIEFNEVTHISKFGYEVVIYTCNREYRTRYSLQEIMKDLPVSDFFRVHKSHIVSLKHMSGIKRKRAKVGEYYLPVSKYYRLLMIKRLEEMLEGEYMFFCVGVLQPFQDFRC